MCSDQHVKYQMSWEFFLTSSLLLAYRVEQYKYMHVVAVDVHEETTLIHVCINAVSTGAI